MNKLQSEEILRKPVGANIRNLYKAMGYSDYDLERPLIGIANSWNMAGPGHSNLRSVAEYVKQGVLQAGGTPVEFGIIGPCDGMGVGNNGMRYCLPARDLIANEVETMVRVNNLDAVVLIGACDKVVPGLLMAAARLDIPAIFVAGGPSLGGVLFDGRSSDNSTLSEALGMLSAGIITRREFDRLEDNAMRCCGSCSFLGTANTLCSVAEALGMSLPGSANVPAVYAQRLRIAQESGRRIVQMLKENLTARKMINNPGLRNAARLGMAIGGSTNLALHLPAIAYEAECDFDMDDLDEISGDTPHLARIFPSGTRNVPDFYEAGGVVAVMKHLEPILECEAMTCTGQNWRSVLSGQPLRENEVIRPLGNPWHPYGSLGVLRGNLAPLSGVTKPVAIDPAMRVFRGKAACFDSEEDTAEAILQNRVHPGTVVVIRYEGPKGGPGMREMAKVMKMLYGQNLALSTAIVTDGRFSGTNNGCFVGHVSPEAIEGGPIAVVRDGDVISIDIPGKKITLEVDDKELARRMAEWRRPLRTPPKGYLHTYAQLAESAHNGAIIRTR